MTTTPSTPLSDLTDAVARGRLTLAELATISGEELEALHAIGVAHLDTGRNEDASILFGALVTLFPFRARFWRAYGVALQRRGLQGEAIAAYDAALALEPQHALTQCHRAEVAFLLGETEASVGEIEALLDHPDPQVAARAESLWGVVGSAHRAERAPWSPYDDVPEFMQPSGADGDRFTLTDGRVLPLEDSMFTEKEAVIEHDDAFVSDADIAEATGVHRTLTQVPTPLPEEPITEARPEGTVITAIARRVHGWPMADDEVTLTSSAPTPKAR